MPSQQVESEQVLRKDVYVDLVKRILATPPEQFAVMTRSDNNFHLPGTPYDSEKTLGEVYMTSIQGFTVSLSCRDPPFGSQLVYTLRVNEGENTILKYEEDLRDMDEKLRPYSVENLYSQVRSNITEMKKREKELGEQKIQQEKEQAKIDAIQRFASVLRT